MLLRRINLNFCFAKTLNFFIVIIIFITVFTLLFKINRKIQIKNSVFICKYNVCNYQYTLINLSSSINKGEVIIILRSHNFHTRNTIGNDKGVIIIPFELQPMSKLNYMGEYKTTEKLDAYFRVYNKPKG